MRRDDLEEQSLPLQNASLDSDWHEVKPSGKLPERRSYHASAIVGEE